MRKIFKIIVIYDSAARCPKFRTVKKKNYYGLNFEKKILGSFWDPNKAETMYKKILICLKIIASYRGLSLFRVNIISVLKCHVLCAKSK